MQQAPDFKTTQQQFTAHLRDPSSVPEPADVESRRMAIYRRLIYNNIESFLSTACPVLKQILGKQLGINWHVILSVNIGAVHPYLMILPAILFTISKSIRSSIKRCLFLLSSPITNGLSWRSE